MTGVPIWESSDLMHQSRKIIPSLFAALLVVGCGGAQVTVKDPSIPEPLIDQMTLNVAAKYPDVFDHFVHEEKVMGKEKWSIDLGGSNRLLFTQLFDSMFTEFEVVAADADTDNLVFDALIEPSIDAFEFSVPSQSQTDEFAVWIRYRIKIFDNQGVQIANWPIAAYGKSLAGSFGGDEALQRAAVLAMRDAAALIILQMDKATGISKLNAAKTNEDAPSSADEEIPLQTTTASEETPDESS